MRGSQHVATVCALSMALAASAVHAGDPTGAAVFKQNCASCHSLRPGAHRYAPSLAGVMGRQAGTLPGFEYSEALTKSGLIWTTATLEPWLRDPHRAVPGSGMPFEGLANPEQRRAVIEFLQRENAAR
jgi:cytochrome c